MGFSHVNTGETFTVLLIGIPLHLTTSLPHYLNTDIPIIDLRSIIMDIVEHNKWKQMAFCLVGVMRWE